MSGIGIRCSHKRAKRNSGTRRKDQVFAHLSLLLFSTFVVVFVSGNNHGSARGLFVVGRLLNMHDKGKKRRVRPATLPHIADHISAYGMPESA
jgi:hypothetical protein